MITGSVPTTEKWVTRASGCQPMLSTTSSPATSRAPRRREDLRGVAGGDHPRPAGRRSQGSQHLQAGLPPHPFIDREAFAVLPCREWGPPGR